MPSNYKWSIGIKKVSWLVGKLLAGFVLGKLVTSGHLTSEQMTQLQVTITAVTASGLEWIHDWAKLKYPDAKWL